MEPLRILLLGKDMLMYTWFDTFKQKIPGAILVCARI
jgi:hypothetical protein